MLRTLVVALVVTLPAVALAQGGRLAEAEKLRQSGKYREALKKYEAVLKGSPDDETYTRALLRAVESQTLLGEHEEALRRIRAASPPKDPGRRGMFHLIRLEMLEQVRHFYGFSEETVEGADGPAKLSQAQARREGEAAIAALWKDRAALAGVPLERASELVALDEVDLKRYPAIWDFVVLRLTELFVRRVREAGPVDGEAFIAAHAARDLDPARAPAEKLSALYEETFRLGGADRRAANERWEVARVMLPHRYGFTMSVAARMTYRQRAVARLTELAIAARTVEGRSDATASAAELLVAGDQMAAALKLCEALLGGKPDAESAMRCRRLRHQILEPELTIEAHATRLPAKGALKLRARNLQTAHVRVWRIDPARDLPSDFPAHVLNRPREELILSWLRKKPLAQLSAPLQDPGNHRWFERTLDVPVQEAGVYLVVASVDPAFPARQKRLQGVFLSVGDLAVARAETKEGFRFYAFDAQTGGPAPQTGFAIQHAQNWGARSAANATAGPDGVAVWMAPKGPRFLQVDALASRGPSWAWFPHVAFRSARDPEPPFVLFLHTDRPIYRPGQALDVRVTAIERAGDGTFRIAAGRKVKLQLRDPNGREVAAREVTTGQMGSATAKLEAPQKGLLGNHSLVATLPRTSPLVSAAITVAVEEYKRPEFEVTLDPPKGAARFGHKLTLTGKVRYYFGGPAPDVAVKFRVYRQRWLPWWLWLDGASTRTQVADGQARTKVDGTFEVAFTPEPDPTKLPSEDPDVPNLADFTVEVEAHDAGGRTLSARRTVRVGDVGVLVAASSEEGFFFSDEAPRLETRMVNLEEQLVAGQASFTLESLVAPKTPPVGGLQAALRTFSAGAKVKEGRVALEAGKPTPLELPKLQAGGYRLTLAAQDPWGKPTRGTFNFVVVDARSRALDLPLPPLAVPKRAEVQVGQSAQVLLGAGAASGHYHLEQWKGRTLAWHRVEKAAPVRVVEASVTPAHLDGFTVRWIGVAGLEVVGGEAHLRVPRKDKALRITFEPRKDALEPGAKATFGVVVKDGLGRPVETEALVRIYDRSLELYARGGGGWADGLYRAPPPPEPRTDGAIRLQAQDVWIAPEVRDRLEKALQGDYQDRALPRFAWAPLRYGPGGPLGGGSYRGRLVVSNGAEDLDSHAPPAPPRAAPGAMAEREEAPKLMAKVAPAPAPPPAAPPAVRTQMAETALFLPNLRTGSDGRGRYDFTAPERLTSWRVEVFALGKKVQAGSADDTFVTRKDLMVRVEIPRFVREGDKATITAVVHNETAKEVSGQVALQVAGEDGQSALKALGVTNPVRAVQVPAHGLASVDFPIEAPRTLGTFKVRALATAGRLQDAEERELPLLPSRERLVQSRVVALAGDAQKTMELADLVKQTDPTLRSEAMVVALEPQLALSILRAIPFLVEYPYECTEQTLNRYVPLAIVNKIYEKHPELAKAIAALPHRKTQHEPWLKDDPRRQLQLTETPWLREAQGGSDDPRLRDLLDPARVAEMGRAALGQLERAQAGDGGFPWFPGGRSDFYMTLYLLEGFAMLRDFGVAAPKAVVERALAYVQRELPRRLDKRSDDLAFLAYGAYVLTTWDAQRFGPVVRPWVDHVMKNRTVLTPFGRAWMARVHDRLGDRALALELLESALDGARTDPVTGTYWTPERYSWRWYSDSVEKHAFFMRTLSALKPGDPRLAGMAQWLLFNRKGNQWHSTKASAAAVYALLDWMQARGALSKPEQLRLRWADLDVNVTVRPDDPGKAPLLYRVDGPEVTPKHGTVTVEKKGPGVAFASATWVFSSEKLQAARDSSLAAIERRFYRRVRKQGGDTLELLKPGAQVKVGDEIEVRLAVRTKSQFEYVHVKAPRGAGFEEAALRSGWRWERLSVYQEPRDSLVNFFIDWLPHGEYELKHTLRPTTPGKYRFGSAVLQSMYAPDITAYSSGFELEVVR